MSVDSCKNSRRHPGVLKESSALQCGMPIYECDPWREQYFESVDCPPDVHIPTDDERAYEFNPRHRWIYDKLRVARSQGMECGPQELAPPRYPVFSKPIINLKGMGVGSCVLRNEHEYRKHCHPGDFWMPLLTGEHVSTDWAVVNGEPQWCRHTVAIPGVAGTFDYWIVHAHWRPRLDQYCKEWIRRYLCGYTGMVNIETMGGRIIEAHLRFADQWPDLYGPKWVDSVVRLYEDGVWRFTDSDRTAGYSVVLFGPHRTTYHYPSAAKLARYRAIFGVRSLQITFLADVPQSVLAMPPGGFRLAIINCVDNRVGFRLRAMLARDFGLQHQECHYGAQPASSRQATVA